MMRKLLLTIFAISILLSPGSALAGEESLALTIIPPLMKMNMKPGESITTAVKIVNNNDREVEFYTKVLDFRGNEDGGVEFIENRDILKGTLEEKFFLSGWVTINEGPIKIPAFKYREIPFIIEVPEDASPGGHYAAILVGTRPSKKTSGTIITISSYLSSLILVSIAGDIEEEGTIREFSTDRRVYKEPKVNFKVNFQNLGNVHLQPVGNIKIYNIFGKEKGNIPINYKTDFGNVLPKSERKWEFSWQNQDDVLIIDRFKAELTMSFGEETRQSDFREIYFWVVDVKLLLIIVGILLFILFLLVFFIRLYIKQSVKNIKRQMGVEEDGPVKKVVKREMPRKEKAVARIKKSKKVIDLRKIKK